jgi:hypothetical protein
MPMKRIVLLLLSLSYASITFAQVGDLLFRDGFEVVAQISVAPTLSFPPQLVASSSAPLPVTITNVGAATLTISAIGNSGANASDFVLDLAGTQFSLAPTSSTTLNVSFAPAAPWQPGTRQALLNVLGNVSGGVVYAAETGQGVTCGGAVPACSSGCADSDGDGLNDAWEIAGGIDINNDGVIDSPHDVLLPGANPNQPDVYLKYDYMVASTTNPFGDAPHSHQPSAAAIDQVAEAFAAHGITLHIDPQHDAIPESFVTTRDPNPTIACAANGNSGSGYTFVTTQSLRQQYLGDRKWAYHYAVFAHSAVVPDTAPCCDGTCGVQPCMSCPADAACGGKPDPSSTGNADVLGPTLILAFGTLADENGFDPSAIAIETQASIFMHELGHNFGLVHGSLAASTDPVLTTQQQECMAYKPNFLSVMNYSFYGNGIPVATQPGLVTPVSCNVDSDCPVGAHCTDDLGSAGGNVCYRVDYASENLLYLDEANLDETFGVGGAAGDTDILSYCSNTSCGLAGPSSGPIDWNHNGSIESFVQVDIDGNPIGTPNRILATTSDWDKLNFNFQCTTAFANEGIGAPATGALLQSSLATSELGNSQARERHVLYPPAAASLLVNPACSDPSVEQSEPVTTQLALLGSANFDVNHVEQSSLSLHGAHPLSVSVEDVNNDGIPDLLLEFHIVDAQTSPQTTHLRLSGWLKNSRAFVGETEMANGCSPWITKGVRFR